MNHKNWIRSSKIIFLNYFGRCGVDGIAVQPVNECTYWYLFDKRDENDNALYLNTKTQLRTYDDTWYTFAVRQWDDVDLGVVRNLRLIHVSDRELLSQSDIIKVMY